VRECFKGLESDTIFVGKLERTISKQKLAKLKAEARDLTEELIKLEETKLTSSAVKSRKDFLSIKLGEIQDAIQKEEKIKML